MVKKKPTVVNNPNQRKAATMKLAGVGTLLSSLPLIGKPIMNLEPPLGAGYRVGLVIIGTGSML